MNRTWPMAACAHLLWAAAICAQIPGGTLRGTVQDSTNARVASGFIRLHSAMLGQARAVNCNDRGEFRIDDLAPGEYTLTASASGFADTSAEVAISVSTVRDLSIIMRPASVAQSVNVQGTSKSISMWPVELASQVHQSVISKQDLLTLPLAARSFANIAYLAPGTEPVEPSDPTKARITAVSTGGSSGLNNELSVDGADNSDDYIGGFLQNFSPDSIQEFAVRTAQEDADTGGTTAGSIVVTTRSGTNAWHGEGGVYERAATLNARFPIENPAPNPKQPFSRQDFVADGAGPILKNMLWSFTAFDAVHELASVAYSQASISQFYAMATLASEGLIPGVSTIDVPRAVSVPFRDYFGSERLDWAQSNRSQWYLRGSVDNYTTHNALVQQGALPSTGLLTHNNYLSVVVSNQYVFNSALLERVLFSASGLHLTQQRNSHLGFALAFPFSSTSLTVSGFETFGDNQFATPITYFPSDRNQQKYQFRDDVAQDFGHHAMKFGVNVIHEPVVGGAFPGSDETLYQFPQNPTYYLGNSSQFITDLNSGATTSNPGGSFSQNIQRVAFYGQDSWRMLRRFTVNFGLRYSTTFGLFDASGRSQAANPGSITLAALGISLVNGTPHDDRKQYAPRVGLVYSPGLKGASVFRAGFGLYFNDLAQTGWATAFQAVDSPAMGCVDPIANPGGAENDGCIAGSASGGVANLIDPGYKTPYALHVTAGVQHSFGSNWLLGADFIHEQGDHAYRAYSYIGGANLFTPRLSETDPAQAQLVPSVNVYHSDNRSSYNGLLVHLQGNANRRMMLVANYTLSKAQTWGCVLGELFDYVNGVCDPLHAFAPGDYGPSGEDVRQRFVFAATLHAPKGFDLSGITQEESARPFTITTADGRERIAIEGVPTALDVFRGTPYLQTDLRASRSISFGERSIITPFVEFFNLFNRNNPGANYVTNIASLPVPEDQAASGNISDICRDSDCTSTTPILSPRQLRLAGGALGDFFGPGTTVGIPFAMQIGLRISF